MSFSELGLSAELLRAVSDQGYTTPTPVQAQAIPTILAGRDLMAGAQTGTGKTAGFTLPLLQRLSENAASGKPSNRRPVRALVLTPTRELAAQVAESVRTYGKYLPLRSTSVFGGMKMKPQIVALRNGVDVLIATPGRLLDHVSQRTVDLSQVEILVLDEADRMLDMGFINAIREIMALLPKQRQSLMFSATFSSEIKQLADRLLNKPALIEVARCDNTAARITQVIHPVDRERKRELLSHLIRSQGLEQVLVFMRTKHSADRLTEQLYSDGIETRALHGNKNQSQRDRALADFKKGRARVLVATDIAARGIDIDQLPHVVNFELPHVPEDYIHRIGRTGRAGASGQAISLVCVDEQKLLGNIRRLVKGDITTVTIEGFEPNKAIRAEPILHGRNGSKSSQGKGRSAAGSSRPQARSGNRPQASQGDARTQRDARPQRDSRPQRDARPPQRDARPAHRSDRPQRDFQARPAWDGAARPAAKARSSRPEFGARTGQAPRSAQTTRPGQGPRTGNGPSARPAQRPAPRGPARSWATGPKQVRELPALLGGKNADGGTRTVRAYVSTHSLLED